MIFVFRRKRLEKTSRTAVTPENTDKTMNLQPTGSLMPLPMDGGGGPAYCDTNVQFSHPIFHPVQTSAPADYALSFDNRVPAMSHFAQENRSIVTMDTVGTDSTTGETPDITLEKLKEPLAKILDVLNSIASAHPIAQVCDVLHKHLRQNSKQCSQVIVGSLTVCPEYPLVVLTNLLHATYQAIFKAELDRGENEIKVVKLLEDMVIMLAPLILYCVDPIINLNNVGH